MLRLPLLSVRSPSEANQTNNTNNNKSKVKKKKKKEQKKIDDEKQTDTAIQILFLLLFDSRNEGVVYINTQVKYSHTMITSNKRNTTQSQPLRGVHFLFFSRKKKK